MEVPMRQGRVVGFCALLLAFPVLAFSAGPDVEQIIRRSVAATQADWEAAPQFSHIERDAETKGESKTVKTYEELMIAGSPYSRLIAIKDEPLSPAEVTQEGEKLRKEIGRRANESAEARVRRLARYQKDRQRTLALMREMVDAFDFKLIGEDKLEGHDVYVLEATPRPGYQPKSRETKVLTGMKGRLWIDKSDYQWVKVEAEVSKPVWFGWFIAKVGPGTRFLLEQAPVVKTLWLPKHFRVEVKAAILWVQRNFIDDETYKDYQPISKGSSP